MASGGTGFGGGFASGMAGGAAAGGGGAGGAAGGMGMMGGMPGMGGGGGGTTSEPLQPGQPVQFGQAPPLQQRAAQTPALLAATRNLQAANELAAMRQPRSVGSGYGPPGQGVGNDSAAAGRAASVASHGNFSAASPSMQSGQPLSGLQSQVSQATAREQELQQMGVPQGSDNANTYFQARDYVNNNADYTPPAILSAANTLSARSYPNE